MGYFSALDFVQQADQDTALRWHLLSNHFPPVPLSMLEPCKQAIANADKGEWDTPITLPDGCTYKGQPTAPTFAVVEQQHLMAFINIDDEED